MDVVLALARNGKLWTAVIGGVVIVIGLTRPDIPKETVLTLAGILAAILAALGVQDVTVNVRAARALKAAESQTDASAPNGKTFPPSA